ncbi:MAG: phosphoribosylformylglycinamidine synthase [Bacteroidetes bacterium GWF2_40_14]|nr:MAG: phosphoribosylformylglycinamidine synthase [Bacteroidetes bacterium GWF2_40_14]
MILFFRSQLNSVIAVKTNKELSSDNINALKWLFDGAHLHPDRSVTGYFAGPRREMITPWSTTAVEITQNMNISGIERIEEFFEVPSMEAEHDKMLQRMYDGLGQEIFEINRKPDPVIQITDIAAYNKEEGLALSDEEISYLDELSKKLGRPLTDGEVFGFSQVNSEHCRHKIFNGTFVIDGREMESSLFKLIKKTSKENPNRIVSAYKDNCAFLEGPEVTMFYPQSGDKPDFFKVQKEETVISLKAETHNFPTTVEPFNGAATGSGGEIRDRIAGGKGSFPIAGTAVYMTSYPRFDVEGRDWENTPEREWLYQTPQEILIKASNGASDFGNKFGQALICGSLLTFEHSEKMRDFGFDKVIMMAGGVGYAKKRYAQKDKPSVGDKVILLGGDNYRIGMGGGAVSSVATGEFENAIELNAVQRSNPEMQKRAYNAIRTLAESDNNSIISVHDHGAGGHLNCLSELVEQTGGDIDISKLPVGDPTLSAKEIIGNESQERMGLVIKASDVEELQKIAARERAPMYVIGETTGRDNFTLENKQTGEKPIDLAIEDMFGSAPKTIMEDFTVAQNWDLLEYDTEELEYYIELVMQLESVACKDWLTNKVDRSVSGLIATQQTAGEIQLPLNNLGVTAIGFGDKKGIATSIGHAPLVAMIDSEAGSRMAISEALTNVVWTPIEGGIKGISLSANWMWPCRNIGEDARLYKAVKAASDFSIELGINIPTGKDSMSMTQKYPDGEKVLSPGTLIVSTVGECKDIRKVVRPVLSKESDASLYYVPFTAITEDSLALGGSAFAQVTNQLGNEVPDINNPQYFAECFDTVQKMIEKELITAGHDISAGGLVTALLEMNFANSDGGIKINLEQLNEKDPVRLLFSEAAGILVQVQDGKKEEFEQLVKENSIAIYNIGKWQKQRKLNIRSYKLDLELDIDHYRDLWFKTSYLFDRLQSGEKLAEKRFANYMNQPLKFSFPAAFSGKLSDYNLPVDNNSNRPVAAIIREKGSNGDREMAWALYLAGFAVKDVHMTDLITGRENLEEVRMIVFVGGFSNADTLGSAKGWAGAFLYNEKAKSAIENFYAREDTLSLGICNGCQLMAELGFITPEDRDNSPKMKHNDSHKYESAFVGVTVEDSPSVMLSTLKGSKLGIWVAHGEGKFHFPQDISRYNIAVRFNYKDYPANPNGSPEGIAGVCSNDGRHLAMMPHPERCIYPHNWAHYTRNRVSDEVTPWIEIFINARKWIQIKS